jgi:hypothetical protein
MASFLLLIGMCALTGLVLYINGWSPWPPRRSLHEPDTQAREPPRADDRSRLRVPVRPAPSRARVASSCRIAQHDPVRGTTPTTSRFSRQALGASAPTTN